MSSIVRISIVWIGNTQFVCFDCFCINANYVRFLKDFRQDMRFKNKTRLRSLFNDDELLKKGKFFTKDELQGKLLN